MKSEKTTKASKQPVQFKEVKSRFWIGLSRWSLIAFAFLLPLLFWPFTTDAVGYGKQILVVTCAGLAAIGWILQALLTGVIKIQKGLFPWFIGLFVLGIIASVVFSTDSGLAFWGSSPNGLSGISLLALGIIVYIGYNIADSALLRKLGVALFSGLSLAMILGLFSLFSSTSIFALLGLSGFLGVSAATFNTIGPINALAVAAGLTLVTAIHALINRDQWFGKRIAGTTITTIALLASLVVVAAINFRSGWLGIAIAGLFITITSLAGKRVINPKLFILPFVLVFISIALYLQLFPQSFGLKSKPFEVQLAPPMSFDLVSKALDNGNFFFGSGFGTFPDIYSANRPPELNNTLFWGVRFNQASSALYTLLAEGGYVTTILLVALILIALGISLKRNQGISPYLVGLAYLATLFVMYPFNSTLWGLLFVFLMLAVMTMRDQAQASDAASTAPKHDIKTISLAKSTGRYLQTSLGLTALVLVIAFGIVFVWQGASANRLMTKPVQAQEINGAITQLSGAITSTYGSDDSYLRALSQAYLIAANRTNISRQERDGLITNAIGAARLAQTYRPKNALNVINLGSVYEAIIGVADGALEYAQKTYEEAAKLDPQNPSLQLAIGRSQFREATRVQSRLEIINQAPSQNREEIQQLEEQFKQLIALSEAQYLKALHLKPDYEPAHLLLVQLYDATGRRNEAIQKAADVVAINPKNAGNWFRLGLLYYQQRAYEQARDALQQAVAASEPYANARYFLGLALEQLGDTDGAIAQFERVAELNPDNQEVQQILANLERGVNPLLNTAPPAPQDRIEPPVGTQTGNTAEQSQALPGDAAEQRPPIQSLQPALDNLKLLP